MLVEQLLPAPARYRLVWHDKGAFTRRIYLWRPVPPSAQFVALGMLATAGDEPPPLDAVCCVPRRWCEHAVATRRVWRDDGQGGRPGSLWATPGMELLLAVQGHEPSEAELRCWVLVESKSTADNTGWLVAQ